MATCTGRVGLHISPTPSLLWQVRMCVYILAFLSFLVPRLLPFLVPRLLPFLVPRLLPFLVPRLLPLLVPRLLPFLVPRLLPFLVPRLLPFLVPRLLPFLVPRLLPFPRPLPFLLFLRTWGRGQYLYRDILLKKRQAHNQISLQNPIRLAIFI